MDYKDFQAGAQGDFFWFSGKHGLISILIDSLKIGRDARILDIGIGTGDELAIVGKFGRVYVIDIDDQVLKFTPRHLVVEKKVGDATAIPYPNTHFDLVVALDVLEHIRDDEKAADEIYRVLKPSGFFVFTVPAFQFLFGAHDRALGHFRRYDKSMVIELLQRFTYRELGYWMCLLFIPVAISKLWKRRAEAQSHPFLLPKSLNSVFGGVLRFENWLIKNGVSLPVGTSIYGVFQKSAKR